ncbi:MAG: hypothetical protein ACYC6W_02095 [Nitrosotalea sp.]
MNTAENNVTKTMAILAIEHTLLNISNRTLEEVQAKLYQEYKCSIQDCYEHPEYLGKVLKDLFGSASNQVIVDVNLYLDEFAYQRPIAEFLDKIRQP